MSLKDRVAALKAAREADSPTPPPASTFDDDLIPEVEPVSFVRSETDVAVDGIIGGIGILDAYARWCGKSKPNPKGKRESIHVSCPMPDHADKHPSAWVNLDKNTGYCPKCAIGFDVYDIAAIHFGYSIPGYKKDGSFPKLRLDIAEACGLVVKRDIKGEYYEVPEKDEPVVSDEDVEPSRPGLVAVPDLVELAKVVELPLEAMCKEPKIDWASFVPEGTFLREWLEVTCKTDKPEEYFFMLGLMAVGFAGGNDVRLSDENDVRSNLLVCLLGGSGSGKTQASTHLKRLLMEAFPYDRDDETSRGVNIVPNPGSAEALMDEFSKPIRDESTLAITGYAPVRGYLDVDEMRGLMEKANRTGSTIKTTLMSLYDGYSRVDIKSRGAGYVCAEGQYLCTLATSQPDALSSVLMREDADSGFANRWIYAAGAMKKAIPHGGMQLDMEELIPLLKGIRLRYGTGRLMELKGDALALFNEQFELHLDPYRRSTKREDAIYGRISLTIKKLILLFAMNAKVDDPGVEQVQQAFALVPYLKDCYRIVASQIGVGTDQACSKEIEKFVRDATGPVKHLQVVRFAEERGYSMRTIKGSLEVLMSLGKIEGEGRGGAVKYTVAS